MDSSASYIHSAEKEAVLPAGLSPPDRDRPLRRRLLGLVVMAGCWGMILVGAWLTPHESGAGTHQELGLPTCDFMARTGWPCPSCGMTTSVSAMAHGRWRLALQAQPFGAALFLAAAALGTAGLAQLLSRRNLLARPRLWLWLGIFVLAGLPTGWALKLLTGWMDGSLPWR
jgi:hypothetical protein